MAGKPGRRKEPAGWQMQIRAQGPGGVRTHKHAGKPGRGRSAAKEDTEAVPVVAPALDAEGRHKVAEALKAIVQAYPFGLLAARIDATDLDLVLHCPITDLALIADLVKRRLMPTLREVGMGGRFWRKGFLRRALGTQGDVRRAVVLLRREARIRRSELIDYVRHDADLGIRTRRPDGTY
jgi:hypothetical protein